MSFMVSESEVGEIEDWLIRGVIFGFEYSILKFYRISFSWINFRTSFVKYHAIFLLSCIIIKNEYIIIIAYIHFTRKILRFPPLIYLNKLDHSPRSESSPRHSLSLPRPHFYLVSFPSPSLTLSLSPPLSPFAEKPR